MERSLAVERENLGSGGREAPPRCSDTAASAASER